MSRRRGRPRARGTLHIVAGLLIASALVRIGVQSGPVMAEQASEIAESTILDTPSNEEVDALLVAFQEREERLAQREELLLKRLEAMRQAEVEIDDKLQALIAAEIALSDMITLADGAAETDLARLTSVYENMKPKEAAALFEEMSPQFAAGFLGMMRPDAAALIMSELEPQTAYSFSVVLAGRHANVPTQ